MKKILSLMLVCALTAFVASANGTEQKKGGAKKNAKTTAVAKTKKNTAKKAATTAAKGNGSFIVISKKDLNLRVYSKDSTLLAEYPCCLSKNKGNKQKKGDMKTPESPAGKPFKITAIQDASTWKHDFKDGRGNILAYGHWFLRLLTPGHSGIGIHGSTNNASSVPGRASEGCIRLRDADIITLKEKYAYVGMPVYIKAEGEGLYPWEK
jgi:lipoprotein-anchoring transpeptidase ErfK/SrfK